MYNKVYHFYQAICFMNKPLDKYGKIESTLFSAKYYKR